MNKLPKAMYWGELEIGGVKLNCMVLNNEQRVFPASSVFKAFGRNKRGTREKDPLITIRGQEIRLPPFIASERLKSFMDKDLIRVIPVVKYLDGDRVIEGYDANIIPEMCNLYILAKEQNVLTKQQLPIARQALKLQMSFAKVGIIALIDEATGFQSDRKKDALRQLVEAYIREDARKWTKEFIDDFFYGLDSVYNNPRTTPRTRPPYYGKFINTYVYQPIEDGLILSEIKSLQNVEPSKRLHQFLNDARGLRVLRDRISKITAILQISKNMQEFNTFFEKIESKQQWFDFDE